MISDELKKLIEKQVNENIDNNILFTAFDVTKTLRMLVNQISDDAGDFIAHRDIRQFLNDNSFVYENRGYTRTLATLKVENKPEAFVYHNKSLNVNHYNIISETDGVSDNKNSSSGKHVLTKEGRLNIGYSYLENAGLSGRDKVCVNSENGKIFINRKFAVDSLLLNVNKDGRIRLSKSFLNKVGMTGNSFSIEIKDKTIEVIPE